MVTATGAVGCRRRSVGVVGGRPGHAAARKALVNRLAGFLLAVAAAVVLFGPPLYAGWAALVAVAAAWILDPPAVRAGLRFGVGARDHFCGFDDRRGGRLGGRPASAGSSLGGMVLLRLLVLTVAAAVLVRSVNAETLLRWTRKIGMETARPGPRSLPQLPAAAGRGRSEMCGRLTGAKPTAPTTTRRLPGLGEVLLAHTARIAEEAAAAASLRGHSALTRPGHWLRTPVQRCRRDRTEQRRQDRDSDCRRRRAARAGCLVAGFVQLGEFKEGHKVGFQLRDLATGEGRIGDPRRAERRRVRHPLSVLREGFRLGREALSRAAADSVVIVDEFGPVELAGRRPHAGGTTGPGGAGLRGAVVVVRRALVPSLLAALDATDAVVIDVEDHGERSAEAIVDSLGLSSGSGGAVTRSDRPWRCQAEARRPRIGSIRYCGARVSRAGWVGGK